MCRSRGVLPDFGRIWAGLGLGLYGVEQFAGSQTTWTGGAPHIPRSILWDLGGTKFQVRLLCAQRYLHNVLSTEVRRRRPQVCELKRKELTEWIWCSWRSCPWCLQWIWCLQELSFPVLLRASMELNHFCLHCFLQGAVISFEMNKKWINYIMDISQNNLSTQGNAVITVSQLKTSQKILWQPF